MAVADFPFEKVVDIDGLKVNLTLTISADVLQAEVDKEVRSTAKKANVRGFRRGKVPESWVRSNYLPGIVQQKATEMTQKIYQLTLEENQWNVAGEPQFDLSTPSLGEDVVLKASFEKVDPIVLKDISSIVVEEPTIDISEDDTKTIVSEYLAKHPEWNEVERAAKKGDKLLIDFAGFLNGDAFPGGQGKEHEVVLGEGSMLDEFEANLVGQKTGSDYEFPLTFPKDYPAKDLAEKTVIFKVKVHQVMGPKKPKLTKEYFKRMGSEATSKAEFEQELIDAYVKENQHVTEGAFRVKLYEALSAAHDDFAMPEIMLKNEAKRLSVAQDDEQGQAKVSRNVKLSLLFQQVIRDYELQCTETDVYEYVVSLKPEYVDTEVFLQWYVKEEERVAHAKFMALEQVVNRFLCEKVSREPKSMPLVDIQAIVEQAA